MRRIFPNYAYSDAPRAQCWWDETIAAPDWPIARGDIRVDVAIVGGGFTGMSAALHLAEQGVAVAVFEARTPGWGASGRNGGFCCLGGSKLSRTAMVRRYGAAATDAYEQAEEDAVDLVADLITRHKIRADTHSRGETQLAHNRRTMNALRSRAGDDMQLHEPDDLAALGLGGRFFGGATTPKGFALNPRKYLFGLARAAQRAGVQLFQASAVTGLGRRDGGHLVATSHAQVKCDAVVVCTNGYSSEDLPVWLAGRYMPAQSSVMVTRPLSEAERVAQGWTSAQMAYDTRNLLHYFRLMPDGRFLFGMRGGLMSSAWADAGIYRRMRRHFDRMFPAWANVETTHHWSGLVCLARDLMPFCGAVPGQAGIYAGLAYHGNGVAMGTYTGRALADLVLEGRADLPAPMQTPLGRFPFGHLRRVIMPPAYLALGLADL